MEQRTNSPTVCVRMSSACLQCRHCMSLQVGNNSMDKVVRCRKYSFSARAYDFRYGNRPMPLLPVTKDCKSTH